MTESETNDCPASTLRTAGSRSATNRLLTTKPTSPSAERLLDELPIAKVGDEHHLGARTALSDAGGRSDTVQPRHRDVEHQEVRLELGGRGDDGQSITYRRDDTSNSF